MITRTPETNKARPIKCVVLLLTSGWALLPRLSSAKTVILFISTPLKSVALAPDKSNFGDCLTLWERNWIMDKGLNNITSLPRVEIHWLKPRINPPAQSAMMVQDIISDGVMVKYPMSIAYFKPSQVTRPATKLCLFLNPALSM